MTEPPPEDRVVLGRKDDLTMVGFQWTGAEPQGLNEPEQAEQLGATWEGDELVTYDVQQLFHLYDHEIDGFMADPD